MLISRLVSLLHSLSLPLSSLTCSFPLSEGGVSHSHTGKHHSVCHYSREIYEAPLHPSDVRGRPSLQCWPQT